MYADPARDNETSIRVLLRERRRGTIGGGATVDDTDPTVSVSPNLSQITASADNSTWTLDLAAPSGQQLAPGTYTGAVGAPGNGTAPGISISGDGVGCDNYYGSFTIYKISATSVNATFSQTCESTTAPPLVGFIRYNATVPTPVPTLPAPPTASLWASAAKPPFAGEPHARLRVAHSLHPYFPTIVR